MAGTPAQNGNNAAGNSDFSRKAEELARGLWGIPRGSDGAKGGPGQSFGAGGMPLPAQAAQWPTPASRDHKGSSPASMIRVNGKTRLDLLDHRAEQAFTRPDLPMSIGGPTFSERLRISRRLRAYVIVCHGRATWRRLLRGRAARRLNPLFVEWLMGWPEGHALCAASETAFIRWQRDMRGALSRLPTVSGPWIWEPPAETPVETQMVLI
ncbi:DNA methyltransferase [Paracoccus alkanivorans]|uniref:DNA methyltransferase n=2 Tax=Paracoccus alkanivorans TaxID=2116655 RepID=A0A3M0MIE5_9RHOB|nr:DNA methyltransferase [Paracoccus alkanivorans]RMC37522.1 DNA methyltransferase [Paracoccus alkanivorans]